MNTPDNAAEFHPQAVDVSGFVQALAALEEIKGREAFGPSISTAFELNDLEAAGQLNDETAGLVQEHAAFMDELTFDERQANFQTAVTETLPLVGLQVETTVTEQLGMSWINADGSHEPVIPGPQEVHQVHLADGAKFAHFLQAAQPTSEDDDTFYAMKVKASGLLYDFKLSLLKTMFPDTNGTASEYDQQTAQQLIQHAGAIATGIEHLGESGYVGGLRQYQAELQAIAEHNQIGDAQSYLLAKYNGLFAESTWYAGDDLGARLNEVLETLDTIKADPQAGDLFRDILERSKARTAASLKEWQPKTTGDPELKERSINQLQMLQTALEHM